MLFCFELWFCVGFSLLWIVSFPHHFLFTFTVFLFTFTVFFFTLCAVNYLASFFVHVKNVKNLLIIRTQREREVWNALINNH